MTRVLYANGQHPGRRAASPSADTRSAHTLLVILLPLLLCLICIARHESLAVMHCAVFYQKKILRENNLAKTHARRTAHTHGYNDERLCVAQCDSRKYIIIHIPIYTGLGGILDTCI